MKFLVVFATVFLAASALSATHHWENFKVKHNKTYKSTVEESIRYGIFRDNVQLINEHNARYALGLETYTMAVNKFADLSAEEFKNKLTLQAQNKPAVNGDLHVFSEGVTAPDSVDWRDKGAVLEVKDQGQCGSCWAFSATGALEGQNVLLNGKSLSLSEQQLLDCSGDYGNGDCDYGGLMTSAFEYIKDHGIESEADYPYETVQRTCRVKTGKTALNIKGYKELPANEEDLKNAVGTIGPISVAMYAEPIQFYDKGIFESKDCVNREQYLDHGVLAVGYGVEGDKPYWIIKNSWGASWGEQGFFRLARNSNNQCGISAMTSYPLL